MCKICIHPETEKTGLIAGCAARQTFETADVDKDEMAAYLSDKPVVLRPHFRALKLETDRNAILNHMKIGYKAYEQGLTDMARSSFEIVRNDISSIYADNDTAQKARSLWYEEGMKKFRGEPYERAMAYYYSGLLFMQDGDWENARACFKSAVLQDAFAEEDQHRCDFGLFFFLEGLASKAAGDEAMARDAIESLKLIRPAFDLDVDKNAVIIVETGYAPRKLADGPGHSELKFFRGKHFEEEKVEISINHGGFVPMLPMEDIYWQASSRGGRPVDKILEGQAVFRQTHYEAGQTLGDVSSTVVMAAPLFDNSGTVSAIGGAIGLIGVANLAAAQSARPRADTRCWDNLPDTVHVYTANLDDGKNVITCRFMDNQGKLVSSPARQTMQVEKSDLPLTVVWMTARNR